MDKKEFPATAFLDDLNINDLQHIWMSWRKEDRDPTVHDEGYNGKIWMNKMTWACFICGGENSQVPATYRWCYIEEIKNGRAKITKEIKAPYERGCDAM